MVSEGTALEIVASVCAVQRELKDIRNNILSRE